MCGSPASGTSRPTKRWSRHRSRLKSLGFPRRAQNARLIVKPLDGQERGGTLTEKDLERQLCEKLRAGFTAVDMPAEFFIHNSTSDAKNLFDLIGNKGYELIEDDSRWNLHPKFMLDIIG